MRKILTRCSVVCLLVLTGCAAQRPVPYSLPPRPQLDPLPPSLELTPEDRTLCQRLLQTFSATEQQLQASCHDTTELLSASKSAEQ